MFQTFRSRVFVILGVQLVALVAIGIIWGVTYIAAALLFLIVNSIVIIQVFEMQEQDNKKRNFSITRVLGTDAKEAFGYGEIGIVTYDEKGNVTWMSDLCHERKLVELNKKIALSIPQITPLIQGEVDIIEVQAQDRYYEVLRKEDTLILFIKDITALKLLQKQYTDESLVLGLINLDNYEEAIQYVDEHKASSITGTIRQSIIEWSKEYNMVLRRYRNDRYMLVTNEQNYRKIVNDKFKILDIIRRDAEKLDVAITLSMSFARGTNDIMALDEMAFSALELAQSRGGDQVVYKKFGQDPKFFGGTTEAFEKRSRVRVRVMAQTIKDLISEASNVIVFGHQNADYDSMGATLGMSSLVRSYHKEAFVIISGGLEEKLGLGMEKYMDVLSKRHQFMTEDEALSLMDENTLVIAVDHHILNQSSGQAVILNSKRVIIIDHHRRGTDLIPNTILLYIEPSASSTSELISELMAYQKTQVDISEIEATFMFTGILIDTHRFRNHVGTRTFEAAAQLKKLGADVLEADELLKDNFSEYEMKATASRQLQLLDHGVVISALDESRKIPRAILSQVADNILSIKDIEAAFVIAVAPDNRVSISARSKGNVNVQVIMEVFHGGGHFSAAAAQIENKTVKEINTKLIETINKYFSEEGISNESDFA